MVSGVAAGLEGMFCVREQTFSSSGYKDHYLSVVWATTGLRRGRTLVPHKIPVGSPNM